jgi:molybdate transport system ATP-binding protein
MLGTEAVGAIVEGQVESVDGASGLASVRLGQGRLLVPGEALVPGRAVRLQLLARDLILATVPPAGLSVRNRLQGIVTGLTSDPPHNMLITLDAGGVPLLARVTAAAAQELQLHTGQALWILVKAVSLRGHAMS